jgi:hypothetical protein
VLIYSDRDPLISEHVREFEEQHGYVDSSQVRNVITERTRVASVRGASQPP